jgi:hypothetical protein
MLTEKYVKEELTGDHEKMIQDDVKRGVKRIAQKITEKGLRYDLTVPLARDVVQHQSELAFPFKRFHIGPDGGSQTAERTLSGVLSMRCRRDRFNLITK